MPAKKVPVQHVVRTRQLARSSRDVIGTIATMIAHALNVLTGANVGFGGNQTAIRKLAHASRIRHFNPFNRIHIDAQVPGVYLIRINAQHQCEIARDHQALNVVGITELKGLIDRLLQTGHAGIPRPIKARQIHRGIERITGCVVRHIRPIKPPYKFSPAQDLSHEALDLSAANF